MFTQTKITTKKYERNKNNGLTFQSQQVSHRFRLKQNIRCDGIEQEKREKKREENKCQD